ncbi:cellulose binding domain-containing protein [Dactylosporangium sp. NPDC005572]|uniref:rhamnogalacturonan lyase family protein n=1 Tax=Dactylosporangium sp. NPDC005572 TaxID=3156889 RepID=UPI0033B1F54A
MALTERSGIVRRTVIAVSAAAAVVAAGVVAVQGAGAAAAGCRVTYTVTNQWQGGFGASVDITNLGDPVNGWALTWTFAAGQAVSQAWNATVTASGSSVRAVDAGYNAAIATNGTVSFGFNGSWATSNPIPVDFALNGVTCTGGTTSPSASPSVPPSSPPPPAGTGKQVEDLDRGLISVRSGSGNLVSWRLLGTEALSTAFNVYRGSTRVATVTDSTNYLDAGAAADASYTVRAVVGGAEQAASAGSLRFTNGYLDVPISPPGSIYSANDASVGDLDGDGVYEIVLKWDPADAKDNSQSGVTSVVYVDAYRLNGQRLWRINLGRNIRAGAHYTQFQVYDYDGDGRAEVAMKTADGTTDGTGRVIGSASADYRNSSGYVLSGPEYLTMFNGQTGAAMSTVDYVPPRGTVSSWGDSYGNRVDRFLAGTAYLDGQRPSLVMARGYYTRAVVAAWDFRNGTLTRRWTYDSGTGNTGAYGQGNHQLSVADVDADGRDEIIYGSAAIDDNGALLWRTGYGHGDALHVGDFIPSRAGLEVYKPTEDGAHPADFMADARTGATIWSHPACSCDNGRGVAGDIYAGSPGAEAWSSSVSGLTSATGVNIGRKPSSTNFLIWWDGDPVRELLDGTHVDKYGTSADTRLLTASGVHANNGTKSTPSLSGDILGDWREEVIWPTTDNTALRVYASPVTSNRRLWTLMHDPQYRVAIAWQNTAYNQPPHPSYFIGDGMSTPPQSAVYVR